MEAETLLRRKEDKGSDTLLGAAHDDLLNLSRSSNLTVLTTPFYPALAQGTKVPVDCGAAGPAGPDKRCARRQNFDSGSTLATKEGGDPWRADAPP